MQLATITNRARRIASRPARGPGRGPAQVSPRSIALRLFATCWMVYVLHFATNTVREIYPALSLGDHLSFDVSEYAGFHPDIFEIPGHGAFINNNPGASIVGAVPYVLTRPLIDAVTGRIRRGRASAGTPPDTTAYDTIYPMAREFHRKARERGLDVKFGLAAAVMQTFAMAPLSALSVVVMFFLLARVTTSLRAAAALAFLYGIATPIFYRTAQLNQNLLVAHCALFAFALLWRPDEGSENGRPHYFLAGLLCGWSVVCDYSGVVVVAVLGGYALARWRASPASSRSSADLMWFASGVALCGGILMAYQWACFGNPLVPAQRYMPPATYTHLGYVGMDWPQLDLLWDTAFGMRFGLFTSAPLLLLALYPPGWTRRTRIVGVREVWCIAWFCVLFFAFCSANQYGRMQFNSGVRHIVPVSPFLFLIVAGVLLRMPPVLAWCVAIITAYWSWCLAMYRDVEQGLGVFESLIHITLEGFRLPWLKTLQAMGYLSDRATPLPLLVLFGAITWVLWGTGTPLTKREPRQLAATHTGNQ